MTEKIGSNKHISVLLPTYNGEKTIKETLACLLGQTFQDFEIIVQDDNSTDNTLKIVRQFKSKKIKIYSNKVNLGYPLNLERCRKNAQGNIYILMAQDDIITYDYFQTIIDIFTKYKNIGTVSRTYYWFENNKENIIRAKPTTNNQGDIVITTSSNLQDICLLIDSLDQLSGLAFQRSFFPGKFHKHVFPCHIYPFLKSFLQHPTYFISDYKIAIRTESSQTRFRSDIYHISPLYSWIKMIKSIFKQREHKYLQKLIIKNFVTKNYIGLFQIRNFGKYSEFLREYIYLIRYNPLNIYNPKLLTIFIFCAIMPRKITKFATDLYKRKILNILLRNKIKTI